MTDHRYAADDRTMPAVTYALYLLGFATGGLTAIIGLILAYAQRGAAGPMAHTHYTFLIRTFGIAVAWLLASAIVFAVGLPLSIILIGIPLLMVAKLMWAVCAIWYGVRCIVGLVYLSRGEAYPRPYAVLA